jgi:omega-amidase
VLFLFALNLLWMDEQLTVCLVQPDLQWENPAANLEQLDRMLEKIVPDTGLVILPETFSTGFTMNSEEFAEEEGGAVLGWMRRKAEEKNVYLTGSLIFREGGKVCNRLFWILPDGEIGGFYDKRHLFRMGREDQYFQPGVARKVFTIGSFRLMPQICYDLRFPVFARNRNDYDILFYVANWPARRHPVWETLLKARAIENQAYVLGVSRVGEDGEGVDHLGGSCVVDPGGQVEGILNGVPGILHSVIELKKIREFREKFPVWKDADRFTIS